MTAEDTVLQGPDGSASPTEARGTAEARDAAATEADPWATFDRWASNLFLIFGLLGFVVGLTVIGIPAASDRPGVLVAVLASTLLALGVLIGTSFGLDRHRAWARPAAWGLLWAMIVIGAGGTVLDLTRSTFTLPLGAIAAAIVLTRRPGRLPRASPDAIRTAALAVVLYLASGIPVILAPLLGS